MDKLTALLDALHAYCDAHDKKPRMVVRAATGNPRLYDRLLKRRDRIDKDFDRIAEAIGFNLTSSIGTDMCAERHDVKDSVKKGAAA